MVGFSDIVQNAAGLSFFVAVATLVKSVLEYTKQSTLHGVVFDILAALPVLPASQAKPPSSALPDSRSIGQSTGTAALQFRV
jgi:hypothetical protein